MGLISEYLPCLLLKDCHLVCCSIKQGVFAFVYISFGRNYTFLLFVNFQLYSLLYLIINCLTLFSDFFIWCQTKYLRHFAPDIFFELMMGKINWNHSLSRFPKAFSFDPQANPSFLCVPKHFSLPSQLSSHPK